MEARWLVAVMNQLVFGAVLLILGLAGFGCALESKPRAVKLGWVVEGEMCRARGPGESVERIQVELGLGPERI
jgi:hypothetical protein